MRPWQRVKKDGIQTHTHNALLGRHENLPLVNAAKLRVDFEKLLVEPLVDGVDQATARARRGSTQKGS